MKPLFYIWIFFVSSINAASSLAAATETTPSPNHAEVCQDSRAIFEFKFSNNTLGLLKIQVKTNVITIYVQGSPAREILFGKAISSKGFVVGRMKGFLAEEYGNRELFGFIKFHDKEHEGMHLSSEETKIMHAHILHKQIEHITLDDLINFAKNISQLLLVDRKEYDSMVNAYKLSCTFK